DWNPNAKRLAAAPDADVWTLAVAGSNVYAGGSFSSIGGQPRRNLAALDVRTGKATLDPKADGGVFALAASGSILYVGGAFSSIGGQPHHYIAALNARTGKATVWNPRANSDVRALAASGGNVYSGGPRLGAWPGFR
ncbi:MAG TPA: hypothetical protein VMF63_11505, partial [Opitutaceae bacterium]|nr:hypothetical protein [Opitutaceae bacterium]